MKGAERRGRASGDVDLSRDVRLVAVDFERDKLEDALPRAGFRADEPSCWIWEGVTVYLTLDAIRATLRAVAALSAPESVLAVTYSPPLDGLLASLAPVVKRAFALFGEPIRSMITQGEMAQLLDEVGFSIREDTSTADWAARYWPFESLDHIRSLERLAVAVRRAS